MIALSVAMTFPADAVDDVIAYVADYAVLSRQDTGCVEYWWARSLEDPNTLRLFEVWESQELMQAHLAQPHGADYAEKVQPKVTKVEVHFYDPATHRAL
jgi:quinol monooxygenase YgiN